MYSVYQGQSVCKAVCIPASQASHANDGDCWSVVLVMVREQHAGDWSCRAGGLVQDGDRGVPGGHHQQHDRELEGWTGVLCYHSQIQTNHHRLQSATARTNNQVSKVSNLIHKLEPELVFQILFENLIQ